MPCSVGSAAFVTRYAPAGEEESSPCLHEFKPSEAKRCPVPFRWVDDFHCRGLGQRVSLEIAGMPYVPLKPTVVLGVCRSAPSRLGRVPESWYRVGCSW